MKYTLFVVIISRKGGKKMDSKVIREQISSHGLHLYEVAHEMNMHDSNLSRLLRYDVPQDKAQKILDAVRKLTNTKS